MYLIKKLLKIELLLNEKQKKKLFILRNDLRDNNCFFPIYSISHAEKNNFRKMINIKG